MSLLVRWTQVSIFDQQMKILTRGLLFLGLFILLLLVVAPFLIPIPPLGGTRPVTELADPDSRFAKVEGIQVHYKQAGQGEPVMVLLHGFLASTYSWRELLTPLAAEGKVVAFDRPAFGLTERPLSWESENPYSPEAQVRLTTGLMDQLGIARAILVGNSAGGAIASLVALEHPERVQALILIDPAIYTGGTPGWVRPLLRLPQARRIGPLFVRSVQTWGRDFGASAWHDPNKLTPEVWEGYTKPLLAENWDRALWEFVLASRPTGLAGQLDELSLPILVITGDDDHIVPAEQSIRLAGELPNAHLVIIPGCGHVPHEKCPEQVIPVIREFVEQLP